MGVKLGERERDAGIGAEGGVMPGIRGLGKAGFHFTHSGRMSEAAVRDEGDGGVPGVGSVCGLHQ